MASSYSKEEFETDRWLIEDIGEIAKKFKRRIKNYKKRQKYYLKKGIFLYPLFSKYKQ